MMSIYKMKVDTYSKLIDDGFDLWRVAFYNGRKRITVQLSSYWEIKDIATDHIYFAVVDDFYYIYTFAKSKSQAIESAMQKLTDYCGNSTIKQEYGVEG